MTITDFMMSEDVFIYEKIAGLIEKAIASGIYKEGEKLPSLRRTASEQKVSLATVIQSYDLLQQKGLIHAKSKSGYFVQRLSNRLIKEPKKSKPELVAKNVSVAELAMSLVDESRQQQMVRIGAAVPQPELLPLANLSRGMAGVARRYYTKVGQYEKSQGYFPLREHIAAIMANAHCVCDADQILVTNGCLEALSLALRAVTQPGDIIAIESPSYFGILQVLENLGLKALEIATDVRQGIDIKQLAEVMQHQVIKACVVMPNFANPLGSIMPEDNRQELMRLLIHHDMVLIEDDSHGVLSYAVPRPAALKAIDRSDRVIYCSSFSKTIAPGLRVGWAVPGKYLQKMCYLKFLDNISSAIHPQLVMTEFLARGSYQRHIKKVVSIYQARIGQFRDWINRYFPPGTRIANPQGGFLLWIELPPQYNALKLYQLAYDNNIAIVPGILFSAQGQYRHHVRLSCAAVEGEQAKQAIKKLGQLMLQ